jgi:hypothetical protein
MWGRLAACATVGYRRCLVRARQAGRLTPLRLPGATIGPQEVLDAAEPFFVALLQFSYIVCDVRNPGAGFRRLHRKLLQQSIESQCFQHRQRPSEGAVDRRKRRGRRSLLTERLNSIHLELGFGIGYSCKS